MRKRKIAITFAGMLIEEVESKEEMERRVERLRTVLVRLGVVGAFIDAESECLACGKFHSEDPDDEQHERLRPGRN